MLAIDAPPRSLNELGVGRGLVRGLLLRHLAAAGTLSGFHLQERLGVPLGILEPILADLNHNHFVDRKGHSDDPRLQNHSLDERFLFHVTDAGRKHAAEVAAVTTHYLGPCPIGVEAAMELVRSQSNHVSVSHENVKKALSELELEPELIEQIGIAMASRASSFLYGPPGNGKSTIARCMAQLLGEPIALPYAVAVGEDVVRVLDPIYHRPAEGVRPADRRLALVSRPLVRTGGELQLSQLELTYDRRGRYYEASLQWKACGGVLVIDDFGRQVESPVRLLNRFIVPMEEGLDYLDLTASGRKIEVPFTSQVVFSTNLAPADLVDEAFLRRISHKILVPDPTPDAYGRIFEREAERQGLEVPPDAIPFILSLYGERPIRGSHPKQLIAHLIYRATYRGEEPRITLQNLRVAFDTYLHPAFVGRPGLVHTIQ